MCKARVKSKTLREKTTSNGQGKLKASEAESVGEPHLAVISPESQGQGQKRCDSQDELEMF